jgi:cellulose synthase/poly-beta-1,6-N-acetylglucosamine synthase-like glycosyltransferase
MVYQHQRFTTQATPHVLRLRWTVVAAMVLTIWALLTFTFILRIPSSITTLVATLPTLSSSKLPHIDARPFESLPPRTNRPLFSIVMPVYNQASTLVRSVTSVTKQKYAFWELILVDDGSTDAQTIELAYSLAAKTQGVRQCMHANKQSVTYVWWI